VVKPGQVLLLTTGAQLKKRQVGTTIQHHAAVVQILGADHEQRIHVTEHPEQNNQLFVFIEESDETGSPSALHLAETLQSANSETWQSAGVNVLSANIQADSLTSVITSTSKSSTNNPPQSSPHPRLSTGIIIAISIGSVGLLVAATLFAVVVVIIIRRKKRQSVAATQSTHTNPYAPQL